MTEFQHKTDSELLKRLEEGAKRKKTKEELEQQRISFIFAGMNRKSGMSKADIEKLLKEAS
ncbi:MAG: hypothetical protein AAFY24_02005 [Pseudomonadota bacterium]